MINTSNKKSKKKCKYAEICKYYREDELLCSNSLGHLSQDEIQDKCRTYQEYEKSTDYKKILDIALGRLYKKKQKIQQKIDDAINWYMEKIDTNIEPKLTN